MCPMLRCVVVHWTSYVTVYHSMCFLCLNARTTLCYGFLCCYAYLMFNCAVMFYDMWCCTCTICYITLCYTMVCYGVLSLLCIIMVSCTMARIHNPQVGSGPRWCYNRPSEQVKKYKKLLLNDRDFLNKIKLHWPVNNLQLHNFAFDPHVL